MRGLLLILSLSVLIELSWTARSNLRSSIYVEQRSLEPTSGPEWESAWEEVAGLVASAPRDRLIASWPRREIIEPNRTTSVYYLKERPNLRWPAESGTLYTVIIVDAGIKRLLPKVYIHWMVSNIPGNVVNIGNEVMEYVTPFSFELDEDGNFMKDPEQSSHPMLLLVFKQPGSIIVEETQAGCSPDITGADPEYTTGRIHDFTELANKYSLELVAGNFIQVPWSGFHTVEMICRVSKCTKQAFPFPIPGVNDMPECQPDMTITDMTIISTKKDKTKEYLKWGSLASLDSAQSQIQNLYPTYSTGKVADFDISEGAFNAPIFSNNQANTLDGIFKVSFFQYPNSSQAIDLFANIIDLVPAFGPPLFETFAGGRPYKIILSRPVDQDFDFTTVLNRPEMIMDLLIVKTMEGKESLHHAKRENLIQRVRNSKNAVAAVKFDVDHQILTDDRNDPLFYDSTNNDIIGLVYKSLAHRRRFQGEIGNDPNIAALGSTFTCVMCATLSPIQRTEYYDGPFD